MAVMDSDMVHFILITNCGAWLDVSVQELSEGERIKFPGGVIMKNFHSNSLNRNSPSIDHICY